MTRALDEFHSSLLCQPWNDLRTLIHPTELFNMRLTLQL